MELSEKVKEKIREYLRKECGAYVGGMSLATLRKREDSGSIEIQKIIDDETNSTTEEVRNIE